MLSVWDPFFAPVQHRHNRRNYWDSFEIMPRALFTDLARLNNMEQVSRMIISRFYVQFFTFIFTGDAGTFARRKLHGDR